jgi:hypothetical protein
MQRGRVKQARNCSGLLPQIINYRANILRRIRDMLMRQALRQRRRPKLPRLRGPRIQGVSTAVAAGCVIPPAIWLVFIFEGWPAPKAWQMMNVIAATRRYPEERVCH